LVENKFFIKNKFFKNFLIQILYQYNFNFQDNNKILENINNLFINKYLNYFYKNNIIKEIFIIKNILNKMIYYLEKKMEEIRIKKILDILKFSMEIKNIFIKKKILIEQKKKEEFLEFNTNNNFKYINFPFKDLFSHDILKYKNLIEFMLVKSNPLIKPFIIEIESEIKHKISKTKIFSDAEREKAYNYLLPKAKTKIIKYFNFISLENSYLNSFLAPDQNYLY
jgi:hypothetical protein